MRKPHIFRMYVICFLGIFLMSWFPLAQAAPVAIKKGDTIRIGAYQNPPKIFLDSHQKLMGIFPDILDQIAQTEGWNTQYLWGSWDQCLARLTTGEIDVMVDVAYSKERAIRFDFSNETVLINWGVLYTRDTNPIRSIQELEGKSIAVMRNSIHTQGEGGIPSLVKTFDISCEFIEKDSYEQVFEAVREGGTDVGVVNRLFGSLHQEKFNLIPSPVVFNPRQLKFAFPLSSRFGTSLRQKIDLQLNQMKKEPGSLFHKIIQSYLSGVFVPWYGSDPAAARLTLTDTEKEWVNAHPNIRLGFDPEFAPFEFLSDSGKYQGAAADYVRLIEARIGIQMTPVPGLTWDQTVAKSQQGEIDILPCIGMTKEREKYLLFSEPYLSFPRVFVTRKGHEIQQIKDLETLRVGVQAKSSHLGYLQENTRISPITFATFAQALTALSKGELDAVIGNLAVATHTIGKLALSNLKIWTHASDDTIPLSFGVRRDWPVLTDLINRALNSISAQEQEQIQKKWFPVEKDVSMDTPTPLSPEEREWVSQHPVIRTGMDMHYAPYSFLDKDGTYQGLAVDMIREVEKQTGLIFFPVPDLEWTQIAAQTREKKLDLILTAVKTTEQEAFLNFTNIYIPTPLAIMTQKDNTGIALAKDLSYRRVALVKGYPFSKKIRQDIPLAIPVIVDSPLEGLTAVSMNKADAYIGVLGINTYLISKNGLTNLKVAGHYDEQENGQRLGVRKDWPMLEQILSKALQTIPPEKSSAIFQKWVPVPTDIRKIQLKTFLSETEKQWILDHPVIRVCADPDWAPVEFTDKRGHYSGISIEYLSLMGKYLGIDFVMEEIKDWHQGFDMLKQGSVDMFSAIMETNSRKKSLLFTTPFLEIPIVIFTGQNRNYIGSLAELIGEKICVVKGYAAEEIFKEKYPYLDLVLAKNTEEALGILERKKATAFVGDILTAGYYIGKLKTTSLKVAGKTPYSAKLSMAVSKDMAPLKNIMDKFFDLLPESEKNGVYQKWISIQYEHGTDVSLLLKTLSPILFVLVLFIYWVNRLKLEIHKRQQTEKELTLARQEAEKANQTKSVFLANMSHEIRTPMNAILGYSQLLNRDRNLTQDQKKNLQTINKSGEHLLNLINDILEISKIEAGKYELDPVVFDLYELLNDIELMFDIRTREKGLAFDIRRSKELTRFIRADQGKMRQILINLMGNAVKFTKKGRISLSVRSRIHTSGLSLVFELEDTGLGISKEHLERIFGSFEQAGGSSMEGGTGLGLAISRNYARLMAGDITVKSNENKGSVFTFSCRVEPGDALECKRPLVQSQVIGFENSDPIKVLIADDRKTNRHLLQQMLERVGFNTREVVNGEEAVQTFIVWQPRIILMDIVMPVLNGVDAIKRIRTLPEGDTVTIIAVSASILMEEKSTVLAAGADGFLRKPFREDELFNLMNLHGAINFIYETIPDTPQTPSLPLDQALSQIPQTLVDDMVKALALGHVKRIHEIINQIGCHDPGNIAVQLKEMADAFDFVAMQKLFQSLNPNR